MFAMHFRRTLRQTVLALMLASADSVAAATTYHVDIDTSAYAGAGYIDLTFLGYPDSDAATATISNFSGALGALVSQDGDVSGTLGSSATLGNSVFYNEVYQSVTLGGLFSFDVDFAGSFHTGTSLDGTTLAIGLLDASQVTYLDAGQPQVQFNLASNNGIDVAGVTPAVYSAIATVSTVSAVPEPSAWLLMLGGVAVVGFAARRRQAAAAFALAA